MHDLGGRQGFGSVVIVPNEPGGYHARWEAATRLLFRVISFLNTCRTDATGLSGTRSNAWMRCCT
jgi:hypothetical protein